DVVEAVEYGVHMFWPGWTRCIVANPSDRDNIGRATNENNRSQSNALQQRLRGLYGRDRRGRGRDRRRAARTGFRERRLRYGRARSRCGGEVLRAAAGWARSVADRVAMAADV